MEGTPDRPDVTARYRDAATAPTGQLQLRWTGGDIDLRGTGHAWLVAHDGRAVLSGTIVFDSEPGAPADAPTAKAVGGGTINVR